MMPTPGDLSNLALFFRIRTVRFQVLHPGYICGHTWKQLMVMPVVWQRRGGNV